MSKTSRYGLTLAALAALALSAGCLAGPSGPYGPSHPAGFFAGLWHGFVAWISFILSLFTDAQMYAVNNTGAGYNFGFLLGMACWLGGGGGGSYHYKCKRRRG